MLLWTRVYTSKVSSTVKVDFSMSADVQSACLSRLVWLIYDRHRYSYHCSHPNPAHPHPHPYTLTGLNWTLLTTPVAFDDILGRGAGVRYYLRLCWKCWQPCQTFATGIRFFSLCHTSLSWQHFSKRQRHPNNITKQLNQKQISILHLSFYRLTVVQASYIWFFTV